MFKLTDSYISETSEMIAKTLTLAEFSANKFENDQSLVLIGEMAELMCELTNDKRDRSSKEAITEELSHVLISSFVYMMQSDISPKEIQQEILKKMHKYGV